MNDMDLIERNQGAIMTSIAVLMDIASLSAHGDYKLKLLKMSEALGRMADETLAHLDAKLNKTPFPKS